MFSCCGIGINCKCLKKQSSSNRLKTLAEMTPIEKKERLNYLRFRMKVIASSVLFIYVLKKGLKIAEAKRMRKTNLKVIIDDHRQSRTTIATIAAKGNTTSRSMILWFCWMSVWL